MKLIDKTIFINAPPSEVYTLLIQADRLVEWMAPVARIDPHPGGEVTWTHLNGDTVSGEFIELVENRRVVFTYGWVRAEVGIPPGSTTVEIDLRATNGGTELHLVHRGLDGPLADAHDAGWSNYLHRLATRAAGRDPGPDPLATERVPTRHELGLR